MPNQVDDSSGTSNIFEYVQVVREALEVILRSVLSNLDPRLYFLISTLTVFVFLAFAWLIVWHFILGKIPVVREIFGLEKSKSKQKDN